MKTLLTTSLIFVLLSLASHAYALPDCTDEREVWDGCTGTYTFASGNKYVGEWKDDKKHGKGTYTFASGDKYVGEWKDDTMHGKGTYTWADGAIYRGYFIDGVRAGKGALTASHGSSYVGEFKDDKRHGKGTLTRANGTVESGIWADGKYLYESVESARSDCAKEAGKAGTEYAAKQIEKTCLAEKQLEPES